jgi:hypothetical protein
MQKIIDFIKQYRDFIITILITGTIFFLLGGCVFAPHEKPVNNTQTNQGNQLALTNWIDVTNRIEVIKFVYTEYSNYTIAPFIGHQINDKFTAEVYKRSATFQLKPWIMERSWMIGAGVKYSLPDQKVYPQGMGGYQISWIGGYIQASEIDFNIMGFIRL